ncbi:hypothetical protein GCM10009680_28150 [Streptomyces yatensis]|uniref:Uncharacterized protein n=1 Tax=Streptomyces yatensis TaxID=155177 RepID=A0ABP4TF67_9ACTN
MVTATPEEYERWMIRDCAHCGRRASKSAEWSDGPICPTCYERATHVRGLCPCCGTDRLLPGRDTGGTPICRDAWHAENLATRRPSQSFLRWCMKTGRMPRLTLPPVQAPAPVIREGTRLSRQDRHSPGHRSRRHLEPIRLRQS